MGCQTKVTIITVVYNGSTSIEKTIKSVVNQTYKNKEYIVIDGASSDNTVEIIKKHSTSINLWVSEPDKGIYDAMNKGISYATGDWIIFMNSGDVFNNENVLSNIFDNENKKTSGKDIIYSDAISVYNRNEVRIKAQSLNRMWLSLITSHQAILTRSNLMKANNFNLKYRICADYDFIYKMYATRKSFLYLPDIIIAKYENDMGLSRTIGPKKILKESISISRKYGTSWQMIKKYTYALFGVISYEFSRLLSKQ